ncbi:hypothetical protein AMS68_007957 [Peltaster fructicola]|uniref:Protein-serine/threonine kinase n=1 Tax=Peltaster fructicola TaxID=286661 RepID=A0A6H0Y756_9PEZI|nr:hypothetical protein AMS68_007957 [Peltaster fructicola]
MWIARGARPRARNSCRPFVQLRGSHASAAPPPWRPSSALDEWVDREARPVSLRQLTVFGRTLSEARLLSSANYVRLELPTRIAHRLRNMQTLPYSALTNQHIKHVYEVYYAAFDRLRKVSEIRTLQENDAFCKLVKTSLSEHLSVIYNLAKAIIEIQDSVPIAVCDQLMTTMLRSRISRNVIAEQHLALTETFHEPWHFPNAVKTQHIDPADDFIGEIFLKCNAAEIINECAAAARRRFATYYRPDKSIPEVKLSGHLETTFPYIPAHLEYIISELLRNSIEAVALEHGSSSQPPPIEVLICEAAQHVIIRVSDRGGGVPVEALPNLWSFAKCTKPTRRLRNLAQTPEVAAATHGEAQPHATSSTRKSGSDLELLSSRSPDAKFGMGLPISRICAEYWAGSLEVHSLEGYGTDTFLQVSRLGNKNETLSTRAAMDAL